MISGVEEIELTSSVWRLLTGVETQDYNFHSLRTSMAMQTAVVHAEVQWKEGRQHESHCLDQCALHCTRNSK